MKFTIIVLAVTSIVIPSKYLFNVRDYEISAVKTWRKLLSSLYAIPSPTFIKADHIVW
jgi:hypothetical protein